jgi:hypothetical protein
VVEAESYGVLADDRALRRIRPLHVVKDPKAPGGQRASAAAFEDDSDGSSMSAYLKSIVDRLGLTDAHVVQGKEAGWAVASIPVATLIAEQQVVEPDPIVDAPEPHPCDPAHALVHGAKSPKGRRDHISKASPLVHIVA